MRTVPHAEREEYIGLPLKRRLQGSERLLETSGQSPQRIIEWFGGGEPQTAEGAMALAAAYQATGKPKEAAELIRGFWRHKIFEAGPQRTMPSSTSQSSSGLPSSSGTPRHAGSAPTRAANTTVCAPARS